VLVYQEVGIVATPTFETDCPDVFSNPGKLLD
jgi:hypothetical protein